MKKKYTDVENPTNVKNIKNEKSKQRIVQEICYASVCVIGCLYLIIIFIYGSVTSYTYDIDERQTFIYVKSIDQINDTIVNCTYREPCQLDCGYIRENLKKIPDECEYIDELYIEIFWGILGCCIILNCLSYCKSEK